MDDLLNEFLEETNESLTKLDQEFIILEKDPNNQEVIGSLFRVMHTIKGTSGFLGFERLQKVAHSAENVMDKVRSKELAADSNVVSMVLEAVDAIKHIVSEIEQNSVEPDVDYSELSNRLNALAKGESKPKEAAPKINKTPDLDEPIDFDPIPADYANSVAAEAINKTPDLDEPIDFDPIPADYASTEEVKVSAQELEKALKGESLPKAISGEDKKKAVEVGIKAIEQGAKQNAPQSVKVSLDVLENLMQITGELVLTRNQLLQLKRTLNSSVSDDVRNSIQRLNIITTELQEGVLKTRMQKVDSIWAKFPRVVRDLAKDLGKKAELKMVGEDTDIDRQMIEAIKDPLTHMIRNAVDHGIEMPEDRIKAGKKETGTIVLSAYHEGGHVIIKITDDGKGINIDRVKQKAIENKLASEKEISLMSERQIYQFIFKPGFSTAEKVTSVSGRGVGMDVVLTNIEKIGGSAEINSVYGKGSEFIIKLPLTLAIMPVLIVQSGDQQYAIPQIRVLEIVRASGKSRYRKKFNLDESKLHRIEKINGKPVLRLRGKIISLISLSETLDLKNEQQENKENFVVICDVGTSVFGIMVDKVYQTEEIVVKSKSLLIKDIDVYSGSTILGDGRVIMILDPNGILKHTGMNAVSEDSKLDQKNTVFDEDEINFLMFKTNSETPKAIPLELVSRLEEIDYSKAELSAGGKVIQYRDNLMKLISIDDGGEVPSQGVKDTIVFADRGHVMGVLVEKVLDIVKEKMEIKSSSSKEGILGSMIINGITTEIIDVSYYISQNFSEWLGHAESNKIEGEFKVIEKKSHILLVDDSSFFRKFMRPIILASNYKVTTAEDGRKGLELLQKHASEIDLVISDIDMPVMNGIEFVKAAKANPETSHIPFIALTSHEESDFDENIHDIGFEGLVTKSNRNKVIQSISEILKEKKLEVINA
jgi:two-component system chemotaxis sensor kinase CheA